MDNFLKRDERCKTAQGDDPAQSRMDPDSCSSLVVLLCCWRFMLSGEGGKMGAHRHFLYQQVTRLDHIANFETLPESFFFVVRMFYFNIPD